VPTFKVFFSDAREQFRLDALHNASSDSRYDSGGSAVPTFKVFFSDAREQFRLGALHNASSDSCGSQQDSNQATLVKVQHLKPPTHGCFFD